MAVGPELIAAAAVLVADLVLDDRARRGAHEDERWSDLRDW